MAPKPFGQELEWAKFAGGSKGEAIVAAVRFLGFQSFRSRGIIGREGLGFQFGGLGIWSLGLAGPWRCSSTAEKLTGSFSNPGLSNGFWEDRIGS